jgi:hypothetical protein
MVYRPSGSQLEGGGGPTFPHAIPCFPMTMPHPCLSHPLPSCLVPLVLIQARGCTSTRPSESNRSSPSVWPKQTNKKKLSCAAPVPHLNQQKKRLRPSMSLFTSADRSCVRDCIWSQTLLLSTTAMQIYLPCNMTRYSRLNAKSGLMEAGNPQINPQCGLMGSCNK